MNSRHLLLVVVWTFPMGIWGADTAGAPAPRAVLRASECTEQTIWSGARKSLEEDLASAHVKPIASIDGGKLASRVADYMRVRQKKDIDDLLGFMVPSDAPTLQEQREFYQKTLASETLLGFRVVGAIEIAGGQGVIQVFSAVLVSVGGRCYEDVLTTRWTTVTDSWRVLPAAGVESVF